MTAKIDTLIQRKKQLEAQIARERARERERARKLDTRRKILAGSMLLEQCERNPATRDSVLRQLDKFLSRPDDRALFDLPPRPETPQGS